MKLCRYDILKFRINIQGAYDGPTGRMVNVLGQWGTDTLVSPFSRHQTGSHDKSPNRVFHVIIPVGVPIDAHVIRQAMVDSLRVGTSQQIDIPENVNPNVSRNKPNTQVYVSWKL